MWAVKLIRCVNTRGFTWLAFAVIAGATPMPHRRVDHGGRAASSGRRARLRGGEGGRRPGRGRAGEGDGGRELRAGGRVAGVDLTEAAARAAGARISIKAIAASIAVGGEGDGRRARRAGGGGKAARAGGGSAAARPGGELPALRWGSPASNRATGRAASSCSRSCSSRAGRASGGKPAPTSRGPCSRTRAKAEA